MKADVRNFRPVMPWQRLSFWWFAGAILLFVVFIRAYPDQLRDVDEQELNNIVSNSKNPVVVEVYLPGCHYCMGVASKLRRISKQSPNKFEFLKIHLDKAEHLAELYHIDAVPRVLVFQNKRLLTNRFTVDSEQELNALIGASK